MLVMVTRMLMMMTKYVTSSIFISAKASSTSEAENLTPKVMRECLR